MEKEEEDKTEKSLNQSDFISLMNYLIKGWSRTFQAVKKHKLLFLSLLILQLFFLLSVGSLSYIYQVKIIENVQKIIEPLENAEFDKGNLEAGQVFGPEIMQVYQSYQALVRDITNFLLWLAGLFLIVNGAVWILSHQLLGRLSSWQERAKARLKFTVASLAIMGPLFIVGYYVIRAMVGLETEMEQFISTVKLFSYVLLAGYYLLLASFAFLHLDSWKDFVKKFFKAAIVELHLTILVLAVNSALIFGSLCLIYYSMNHWQNFPLMIASSFLLLVITVLTRLFWISCLEEIAE